MEATLDFMILIISNKWDITVDYVISELRKRNAKFLRINTEDLIYEQVAITFQDFNISISKQGKTYDLTNSIKVIWNRRPGRPFDNIDANDRPSLAIQNFVGDQWFSWLEALQLIPGVTWINNPQTNDSMESKPRQLLLASQVGFLIPNTIITNGPDHIRQFAKKNSDSLIVKALYSPLIEEPDKDFFIFTNELNIADLNSDKEIKISPSIFQQSLRPKIDYRVTVIGDIVFSVKINNLIDNNLSNIDWRVEKNNLSFSSCVLPLNIEMMCKKFVKDSGLIFGAIDLVEHNGQFYFLEINPNGEWGWLQHPHDIPIAEALCDILIEYDDKR